MKKKKVVIALGGNALGKNVEEQKEAVAKTAKVIVDLVSQGLDIIITHGNGPQVGMIQDAMDSLVVQHENYKQVPLPTCVAMSQGYIGIDLQNAIKYELYSRGIDGKVSTILSQVEVDEQDPAFQNPTKPIGRFLTKEEAEKNMAHGISCMEDAGRGYRIVVPSPMLAEKLDADYLVILTAVEKVAIHFGKEDQQWLSDLTVEQAEKYMAQGEFAKGSMLPKIEAAVRFARSGEGRSTLITLLDKAAEGIAGKTGTMIHS